MKTESPHNPQPPPARPGVGGVSPQSVPGKDRKDGLSGGSEPERQEDDAIQVAPSKMGRAAVWLCIMSILLLGLVAAVLLWLKLCSRAP